MTDAPMTDPRQTLCDLMDGRLQGEPLHQAISQACASDSRGDAARADWHAWHVAGDVLRSADLAACRHGAAFTACVMQRIGQEAQPPIAATALPPARPAANDRRWKLAAGLASFAAAAAIGWNFWSLSGSAASPQLAQTAPATQAAAPVEAAAPAAYAVGTPQGAMLRDSRLDEFLAAHRQAAGASALGQTQGFLRNATFVDGSAAGR
ncbi:MAG: sigma-E factor negative regulatory protein [Ottowia sp.]